MTYMMDTPLPITITGAYVDCLGRDVWVSKKINTHPKMTGIEAARNVH